MIDSSIWASVRRWVEWAEFEWTMTLADLRFWAASYVLTFLHAIGWIPEEITLEGIDFEDLPIP